MKKLYTLLLLSLSAYVGTAQINQTIGFDAWSSPTNNDKYNNFKDGNHLLQKSFDGINDGGCLEPTPSASSYSDVAKYRQLLQISSAATTASICFQFDNFDYSNYDDGAILAFLNADGTGGLSFKASGEKITIHSSAGDKTISYAKLTDQHWYQLKAKIALKPGQPTHLLASIYLYDIGAGGVSSPTLMQSNVDQDMDIAFAGNMAQLTLDGSNNGGAAVLDNFNVSGQAALGINEQQLASTFRVSDLITEHIQITTSLSDPVNYRLYAIDGATVGAGKFTSSATIDCSTLPAAPYVLQLVTEYGTVSRKLMKY